MTDNKLVAELRARAASKSEADCMREAADEIERLEAERDEWKESNRLSAADAVANANERDRLRKALRKIRADSGSVCDQYEICEHRSCASSYNAWAIADQALAEAKQ